MNIFDNPQLGRILCEALVRAAPPDAPCHQPPPPPSLRERIVSAVGFTPRPNWEQDAIEQAQKWVALRQSQGRLSR